MEKTVFSNFLTKTKVALQKTGDILARAVEEPLPQNATAIHMGILIKNTFGFMDKVYVQELGSVQSPVIVVIPGVELTRDEFAKKLSNRLRREGFTLVAETDAIYAVTNSKASYTVYFADTDVTRAVVKRLPYLIEI